MALLLNNLQAMVSQQGTKAQIEAMTGTTSEICFAYATDTEELGVFVDGGWVWHGSGEESRSETLVADNTIPLVMLTNEVEDDYLFEG